MHVKARMIFEPGVHGEQRILTDILTRVGAINLARLANLGLHHGPTRWAIA